MSDLKELIDALEIKEKRERLKHNKIVILQIKKRMSDLSLYWNVSKYIYACDKLKYCEEYEKEDYLERIKALKDDKEVIAYIELKKHLDKLYDEIRDYYLSVQKDLREELLYYDLPEIFVDQGSVIDGGNLKEAKHIVVPSAMLFYEGNDCGESLVGPYAQLDSKRKKRHFYNKVSFRYLEELTKDDSFDLENKDLGKVKVYTK